MRLDLDLKASPAEITAGSEWLMTPAPLAALSRYKTDHLEMIAMLGKSQYKCDVPLE